MRIGFCGSHGTGKTSTALELAEQTGFRMVTSASRLVHSIGYDINDKATVVSQAATSMARLAAQLDAGDRFVSDRTLLDSMAYNQYQLEHMWAEDPKAQFWYDTMDVITKHQMHQYDLVVYFPITFGLVADGIRATDIDYQWNIQHRVEELLDSYGVNYYTIPEGTVEYRVNTLKELIDEAT